jgi:hypothetical protein
MSYLDRFGRFLYDFLVGDAWELFVGPLAVLLGCWLLVQLGAAAAVVGLAFFAGVVAVAGLSVWVALRGAA